MKRSRGTSRHRPHADPPSRPSDEGTAAARDRVRVYLDRCARVDLQSVVVSPPDEVRIGARGRARSASIVAGRGSLLDEAVAAVQEMTMRGFSRGGFSGTWALTATSASVAGSADRVAASAALEEGAMAAIVEDLVDVQTLDILRSTAAGMVDMTGFTAPGSLAAIAAPGTLPEHLSAQVLVVIAAAVVCVVLFLGGAMSLSAATALGLAIGVGLRRRRRPTTT